MTQARAHTKRPKDRRQSIQQAAATLFAAQGFAGTGLADIATAVGVTPAALYRHFPSKDALLETIVIEALENLAGAAEEAARATSADPDRRLPHLLDVVLARSQAAPESVTIYLRERHHLVGPARDRRREAEDRIAAGLRAPILEVNPDLGRHELNLRLRAMTGVLASAGIQRHVVPPERVRALFVDGLTAICLARPVPPVASSPEPAVRTWTPPRTRREDILAAAARLFRVYGYHGAGIDQIGEAAGIAGPTVYGTYPSKADILVDTVESAVATLGVLTDRALGEAGSADEAIDLLVRHYTEAMISNFDVVAVGSREIGNLPPADHARISRRREDYRQRNRAVLLEVRPELTDAEARTLFTGAYSLVGEVARAPHTTLSDAEVAATLMVTFLRGG